MMIIKPEIIDIAPDNNLYPNKIHTFFKKAPKLSAIGNIQLLKHKNSVGFCGSRQANNSSLGATQNCIKELAKNDNNMVIVSGNALGVDLEAHYTALKEGVNTILVLAEGIKRFKVKQKLKSVWCWDKVLVVSQFSDDAVWRVWQAMARNNLILALSKAMVGVEVGESGGTKAATDSAITHNVPLFVMGYQQNPAGNALLKESEAVSIIYKNKQTGRANITGIEKVLYSNHELTAVQTELSFKFWGRE